MLILHKTVADDVNLTKDNCDVNFTKTVADDVNLTKDNCRRC